MGRLFAAAWNVRVRRLPDADEDAWILRRPEFDRSETSPGQDGAPVSTAGGTRNGVALVTGAARRIGAAVVRALHRRGLSVAVHYRASRDEAQTLARALDRERAGAVATFGCDLLDPGAPVRLVSDVVSRFGALDVLINNASSFYPTPIDTTTEAEWDDLIGTNLKAPFFVTKAAARFLTASRGSIVNLADIHGQNPVAGYPAYCSAKAGLIMLTRAMAIELAPEIRVNAVAPGIALWPESDHDAGARARAVQLVPLRRTGSAEEVADAVTWLALDAPYTTGEVLAVDGGRGLATIEP